MQFWNKKNSYHIDSEKKPKKSYGNPTWPNISYEGFKGSKSKNSIFVFFSRVNVFRCWTIYVRSCLKKTK